MPRSTNRARAHLFVISGPSGVGKTTITKRLLEELKDLAPSISYTTREKRAEEQAGKDYHFISCKQFKSLIKAGELLEYAQVHGHYYGTSRREVLAQLAQGKSLILRIDVQGARQLRRKGGKMRLPLTSIFILPPSRKELQHRIEKRGTESKEQRELRVEAALREIEEGAKYDYLVVNDELGKTIRWVEAIILAERDEDWLLKALV